MRAYKRRTATTATTGRVANKDRFDETPNYWNTPQKIPVIDKERPGRGYKHVLRKDDILRFINILPHWDELSEGLDAIVLCEGEHDGFGWYTEGVVGICAWERDIWIQVGQDFVNEHAELFALLGVETEQRAPWVLCKFTEAQARAFQLVNILLHELGHHHDRMTTRSRLYCARGEPYAEEYARRYERIIWDRYVEEFGLI